MECRLHGQAHAAACSALGLTDLDRSLLTLSGDATSNLADVVAVVCNSLASAFFPRQAIK
jgi:hypothetical protein